MEKTNFVPADPRCGKCYYWQSLSGYSGCTMGCHYVLEKGKCRQRISETECGSFLDRADGKPHKETFNEVPITQWGCPELVDWKSQR